MVLIEEIMKFFESTDVYEFPSPYGDYGSYLFITGGIYVCYRVSVPLRGLWFLSCVEVEPGTTVNMEFPSPCGDYGSYQFGTYGFISQGRRFRPLAGIMVLIDGIVEGEPFDEMPVSVPLRGLWFLSGVMVMTIACGNGQVSVPLRGLWFLSEKDGQISIEEIQKFPSPCGDYGSYRLA